MKVGVEESEIAEFLTVGDRVKRYGDWWTITGREAKMDRSGIRWSVKRVDGDEEQIWTTHPYMRWLTIRASNVRGGV